MLFNRSIIYILLNILLLMGVLMQPVQAAPVDPSDYSSLTANLQTFIVNAENAVTSILAFGQYQSFVDTLYLFFAVLLIIFSISKYINGALAVGDILSLVIVLLMTRLLITEFDALTGALWRWSQGFGGAISQAAIGDDALYAPMGFIWRLMAGIEFEGYNILFSPLKWIATIFAMIIAFFLSLIAILATVWAVWGYLVAKIIGLMFVPTIMFDKLSFLFDGWLRFFFGFLIYSVIARVNLILVVLALSSLYGIAPLSSNPTVIHIGGRVLFELAGLLSILVVCILALISTGRFVAAVVGGTNMGMGGAMAGFAVGVSRTIMRGR